MRKYYCPYCGKKCINILKKWPRIIEREKTVIYRCCPECSEVLVKKSNGIVPVVVLYSGIAIPFIISLFVKIPDAFFRVAIFPLILSFLLSIVFSSKFVKLDDDQIDKCYNRGTMKFAKSFIFPIWHFLCESVSVLEVDGEQIPIRIEPIEIGIKSGKFKFNCIADNSRLKIDTEGKKLKVLDGEKVIGYMTVEKYIPIN